MEAMDNVRSLVETFARQLAAIVEQQAIQRARVSIESAFGSASKGTNSTSYGRPRRKLPRQLCPVPGCTNTAAPVFGMVCSTHKDVPKSQIAKYREARRAKKLKAAA